MYKNVAISDFNKSEQWYIIVGIYRWSMADTDINVCPISIKWIPSVHWHDSEITNDFLLMFLDIETFIIYIIIDHL